jgi:hypothetical protein
MINRILTRIASAGCKIVLNNTIEKEINHVWFN